MRYLIGLLLLSVVSGLSLCVHSHAGEDGLKPLDPSRPMYQKKEGFPSTVITWPIPGGVIEKRLPDPVTVDEMEKKIEIQELRHKQEMKESERERDVKQKQFESFWGGIAKMGGWALIVIGIAGHCCTTFPLLKNWASSAITLGGGAVVGGLAIQKTVQYDKYMTVGFFLLLGGLVMYLFRNWSISHLPKNIGNIVKKIGKKKDG